MVVVIAVSGRVLASIAGPPCDGPLPSLLPPDLHQPGGAVLQPLLSIYLYIHIIYLYLGGAVLQPLLRPPPLLPRAPLHLQGRHPGGDPQGGHGMNICNIRHKTSVFNTYTKKEGENKAK